MGFSPLLSSVNLPVRSRHMLTTEQTRCNLMIHPVGFYFNGRVLKWQFYRGFWDFGCLVVANLWRRCVELSGQGGFLTDGFFEADFMQVFGIYFGGEIGRHTAGLKPHSCLWLMCGLPIGFTI